MYLYILFSNYKNETKIKNKKEFGKKNAKNISFCFFSHFYYPLIQSLNKQP